MLNTIEMYYLQTVKFNPTEGRYHKGDTQIRGEGRICQEIDFDNMRKQFQTDYLDRYEGVQAQIVSFCRYNILW